MGVGVVFVELLTVDFYPISMIFLNGGAASAGMSGFSGTFANFQSALKPAIWYRDWWISMYSYIMGDCFENDMGCLKKL